MKKLVLFITFSWITISLSAQVIANPAPDLYACDTNNDGSEIFDLTVNDLIIIGSQNPAELQLTYHLSQADALIGINPIANSSSHVAFAPSETIFARLEELATGDFATTSFEVIIYPTPDAPVVGFGNLAACDVSGFAEFDLTQNDPFVLGNQSPFEFTISYHTTALDAMSGMNEILNSMNFVSSGQTIFVRLENMDTECYRVSSFELIVSDPPQITEPDNLFINEGDGDGFAFFDLTVNEAVMLAGLDPQDYYVSYFENELDAQNSFPPLSDPMAYMNIENPQTIYVRVETVNTGCYVVSSFEIATDETSPDADDDGIANEDEDINNNGNLNDDDTDGDNIPNYLDSDDDGDSVLTLDETSGIGAGVAPSYIYIDTDGDTIENYLDNDDDGDGTLTIDEDYNNNGTPIDDDTNTNGIPDFLDDEVFLSVNYSAFTDLSAFPNPTSESFTVQATKLVSETTISLYDIQGKLLISKKILPQNGTLTVDVYSLENGVYFMKVSSEGKSVVKKLIKN